MKCDRCDNPHWFMLRRPTPSQRLYLCRSCTEKYDDSDERHKAYVVREEDNGDPACDVIRCAHGMGLAGMGRCSTRGEWWNRGCPYFITHEGDAAASLVGSECVGKGGK